jgi:hypothetical protein
MAKLHVAENRNAFRKYGARFLKRGGKSEIVEGKQFDLPPSDAEQINDLSWAGYSPELGASPYGNAYGHATGTNEVFGSSIVEFSGKNGAPERIRTADPQIRSLGSTIEIIEVRSRRGNRKRN